MSKKSNTKSRRANNEGTLYQRKDGRWCAQVTVSYQDNGKPNRKTIYGRDQKDVLYKLKQISLKAMQNDYFEAEKTDATLKEAYMEWLLTFKKPTVTGRTFEGYIFRANSHIFKIGHLQLQKVGLLDVQNVLNQMDNRNLSSAHIKKVKNDLTQFFDYAVDEKIVSTSLMKNVAIARRKRKMHGENDYFAVPEDLRQKVIDALQNEPLLKPMILTMMFAGLRTGELLALKWKNVDLKKALINIDSAISTNAYFDEEVTF